MSLSKNNQQVGAAGILAIIVLAFLGLVGAGMVLRTSTEVDMAAKYRDGVAAQYLAESGARWAIVKLQEDPTFVVTGQASPPMNTGPTAGSYMVTIASSGNSRTITSIGTVGKSKRMVYFQVTTAASVFQSAVFCGPNFVAEQNTHISGSIGTNGNAIFGQNSVVSGVASAHGTVTTQQNSSVPEAEGVPLVDIPVFTIPWDNNSSNLSAPTWPLSGGNYFVNGSLVLDQNTTYSGNGASTIYVKDSIVIGQNVTLSGNIKLVALKDVTIEQNMDIIGDVALLAGGDIKIGQNFGRKSGDTASVLLAAQGTIDVEQNFSKGSDNFKASLYANGAISLGQGSKLMGFVISGSGATMRQNVSITYDDSFAGHTELPAGTSFTIGPWSSYK